MFSLRSSEFHSPKQPGWVTPGEKKRSSEEALPLGKKSKEEEDAEIDKLLDEIFSSKPPEAPKAPVSSGESDAIDEETSDVDKLINSLGMNNLPPVFQKYSFKLYIPVLRNLQIGSMLEICPM